MKIGFSFFFLFGVFFGIGKVLFFSFYVFFVCVCLRDFPFAFDFRFSFFRGVQPKTRQKGYTFRETCDIAHMLNLFNLLCIHLRSRKMS